MKSIEVIVGPDGSLKIDAVGFQGADCERATAFLEKALGRVSTKHKKPEHYRRTLTQQQVGG
ncbi:MAG: DUF2997 domain-containing protein [bacterium]